ncbi:hypothetical protein L0F63_004184 [Massospora cicadina]|nr:hypothetical protein L0F63_004184 [Massospora cicadina]
MSRYHVLVERYSKDLLVEANTLVSLIRTSILPSTFEYRKHLADAAIALNSLDLDAPEKTLLEETSPLVAQLLEAVRTLEGHIERAQTLEEEAQAEACTKEIVPAMESVREVADKLEQLVADKFWPLPKYREILFI